MSKGDIEIVTDEDTGEWVTFDPRISSDKKTFTLILESSDPKSEDEYLDAILDYVIDKMEQAEGGSIDPSKH